MIGLVVEYGVIWVLIFDNVLEGMLVRRLVIRGGILKYVSFFG